MIYHRLEPIFLHIDQHFPFLEITTLEVLKRCHDAPCIVSDGRTRFHSSSGNGAFKARRSEEQRSLGLSIPEYNGFQSRLFIHGIWHVSATLIDAQEEEIKYRYIFYFVFFSFAINQPS